MDKPGGPRRTLFSSLLEGRFNVVQMAIAIPKGRGPAALDYLNGFIAAVKADGTVAGAIQRSGLRGVHVAPG